ncbi:DUF397 domain-containing protein [Amycolatopsis sp. H20-H5]|uniref:DUF397 domain-containing protein n=1 Tax=Amycolatopsis sp. H20-H5 TaxID=3046309 RepID=UPI002DB9746E|nr:DUF397 domain-containing protein [Amycolatopsis sp. H20-H5]MEC3979459.1 DUF397 domain-containing protein [Amycolatopsis sp. H20-H5]
MIAHDFSQAAWRKSSYSSSDANCVEVGAWRKSSHSSDDANCVEIALTAPVVGVRDTKDRDGGTLAWSGPAWSAFVESYQSAGA